MAVMTMTVQGERLRKVEEYAKKEDKPREMIVDEAIDTFLRKKMLNEIREQSTAKGITEEVISEEIRQYREELKRAV